MAYSEKLAGKIRQALAHLPKVEEKKMFGGIAFMIGGKMCLTVGVDRMMCALTQTFMKQLSKEKAAGLWL